MKNVKLIVHNTQSLYFNTFHSFPKCIRDKVYDKIELELIKKRFGIPSKEGYELFKFSQHN
jgi:hypothetical protein